MAHPQQQSLPNSIRKPVNTQKYNINPPCAVQCGLSKKAQRYIGYNGMCLAPSGMTPSTVRAYEQEMTETKTNMVGPLY